MRQTIRRFGGGSSHGGAGYEDDESGKKVVLSAVFRYSAARAGTPGGLRGDKIQYAGA